MKLKEDQTRIKELLKDTITLLCKNGLHYKGGFSVEALIGITLDEDDVFLVSIKESVQTEEAKKSSSGVDVQVQRRHATEGSESEYEATPQKKDGTSARISRKRPPDRSPSGPMDEASPVKTFKMHSDPDDNSDASSANFPSDTNKEFNIKSEPVDDDELVFVKQEGVTSFSSCAQSGQNETGSFSLGTYGSPNTNTPLITHGMTNQNFSFDSQTGSTSTIPGISSWASSQPGALNSSGHAITSQGSQQQICPICAKVCHAKQGFADHMRGIHGVGKPVLCNFCGQGFKWRSSLAHHKKKCPALLSFVPHTVSQQEDKDQEEKTKLWFKQYVKHRDKNQEK